VADFSKASIKSNATSDLSKLSSLFLILI